MKRLVRIGMTVVMLSALAALAIVALPFVSSGSAAAETVILDEFIVQQGELTVTVSGTGTLAPLREVPLGFQLSAPVAEVLVQEGQPAEAGDVLARLEAHDLEAAVADARIGVQMQQIAYEELTAPAREVDIAAARADLNAALASAGSASFGADEYATEIARLETELARNRLWQTQLQRDGVVAVPPEFRELSGDAGVQETQANSAVSQAEFGVEIADTNYEGVLNEGPDVAMLASANAEAVAAQVRLDRLLNGPSDLELQMAEIDLRTAQLALERVQVALDNAVLTAPFAGIVAQNNLVVGELPPQEVALLLIDPSSYYVDLPIDETDIVDVQAGQQVELLFDALPDAATTGTVTRVAVTPTTVGQLVTYTVRVTLDPTGEPVRTGMSVTAIIAVNYLEDALIVPNNFIRIDRTSQQAYVTIQREDGRFEEISVTLGLRNETNSQIVGGLAAGQRVVRLPREAFNPFE